MKKIETSDLSMQNIKNIIFDLGGVILNIDFKKTEEAFQLLGLNNFSDHISQHHITDFFEKYEQANQLFAEHLLKIIRPGDTIWIHDYQLFFITRIDPRKNTGRQNWFLSPYPLSVF